MAGVNLNEENARILATSSEIVGTKIRSCKDEFFLPADVLHRRILDTGGCRRCLGRWWRSVQCAVAPFRPAGAEIALMPAAEVLLF